MKKSILLMLWLFPAVIYSQTLNYDIYLIDIKKPQTGNLTFDKAVNISNHAGYDNQPSFSKKGMQILYTQMQDSTTEIYYCWHDHDRKTGYYSNTVNTSEYSPTQFSESEILIVRVESDGKTQRLAKLYETGKIKTFLPKIDSIGYFCLLPKKQIAAFILSSKNELAHELRLIDTKTQKETFIDDSIGRCIRLAPDSSAIVYVKKKSDGKHQIMRYNFHDKSITKLIETVEGAEDFLFYDNTRIWMAKDNILYEYWMAAKFPHWSEKKEFSETNSHLKTITRMNLSPDKTKLVLVAEDGN